MSTIPTPIPGGGGVPGSYQKEFATAVWQSKPPAFQPLYNGKAGAPNEKLPELSLAERNGLAKQLFQSGAVVDPEIDTGGLDPLSIMVARERQGWAWVKSGTGLDLSTEVEPMGNSLPAPAGTILVSTNIADFAPDPNTMLIVNPPPPPAPVQGPKIANPVGVRITFGSPNAIGDFFRQVVDKNGNDGYNVTDTWMGVSGSYSGTWMKDSEEAGMFIAWKKTA